MRMERWLWASVVAVSITVTLSAQPTFEVASINPNKAGFGSPQRVDIQSDRVNIVNVTARTRTGLKILDAAGTERIGISALNNGDAVIGLDAPLGNGDDRNKERINLVADAKGGSSIVFKDRRTSVAARMYLDAQNQVWMQFSDFTQTPAVLRRIGLKGEETIRP
jgi:hypothetical protein